ncbi:replication-relaxation family protein [Rossellomorea sp. BNER]|uniref:replication-relaxation family protein n=1 Tax=Rossellomorea sp. BNER TaxID=2962031 RepID=UPI003AF28A01|nr:replication-relaxation family protein [Rossellomorea sp. BNER]
MRKRDLEILKSLEKFKVLTRDQIAALHFNHNANPHINANRVLKRLRDTGYIQANTDRSFHQYIYFNNPSLIKTDSQKIEHYLMIAQTYVDMLKYSQVRQFHIETLIPDFKLIPDVFAQWLNKNWFIECQNSLYTSKQLYKKLDKYVQYYESEEWKNKSISETCFPNVLIIGKVNLKFKSDDYPFKVKQVREIEDLSKAIEEAKRVKYKQFKVENGIQSNGLLKMKG